MKYVKPKYEQIKCDSKDIITASKGFSVNQNAEDDKTEYEVSPDKIFGF